MIAAPSLPGESTRVGEHELKSLPENFEPAWRGDKTHEVRETHDRDFRVGDRVRLREYAMSEVGGGSYTGRELHIVITNITPPGKYGLDAGHCVFSFRVLSTIPSGGSA